MLGGPFSSYFIWGTPVGTQGVKLKILLRSYFLFQIKANKMSHDLIITLIIRITVMNNKQYRSRTRKVIMEERKET